MLKVMYQHDYEVIMEMFCYDCYHHPVLSPSLTLCTHDPSKLWEKRGLFNTMFANFKKKGGWFPEHVLEI